MKGMLKIIQTMFPVWTWISFRILAILPNLINFAKPCIYKPQYGRCIAYELTKRRNSFIDLWKWINNQQGDGQASFISLPPPPPHIKLAYIVSKNYCHNIIRKQNQDQKQPYANLYENNGCWSVFLPPQTSIFLSPHFEPKNSISQREKERTHFILLSLFTCC